MVLGTPSEYVGDGTDDNLIQGYLIDEKLIGMVVKCIQPMADKSVHPTDGKR
jgi:hypothetical protein